MTSTGQTVNEPIPPQDNNLHLSLPDNELPPSYEIDTITLFRAEDYVKDGKKHILLAASGSVATIKLPEIIKHLAHTTDISIRIVLTTPATHFFSGASPETPTLETLRSLPHVEAIYTDPDEWSSPWTRGNAILHIELRKWTDIMVIAPLDANTLAKMANGLSDNLLTSVLRAWDPEGNLNPPGREGRQKFLLVAPAMNTAMWLHPATEKHIKVLEDEWALLREFKKSSRHVQSEGTSGYTVSMKPWAKILRPVEKELACGDSGVGAMMSVKDIVADILWQVRKFD